MENEYVDLELRQFEEKQAQLEAHKFDIGIRYENKDVPELRTNSKGDWVDLYAAEDVSFKNGDFKLISLGVSMKLPEGYFAVVVPRSSLFKKTGLLQANSAGIIDNSYCGDNDIWKFPAFATRDVEIHCGERIAQFTIFPINRLYFHSVLHLSDSDRGGFGSSGGYIEK